MTTHSSKTSTIFSVVLSKLAMEMLKSPVKLNMSQLYPTVTLTVEPGVEVKGTADGVLLVTRGSKLADAYANNPITFSSLDDNYDGTGEWGGG